MARLGAGRTTKAERIYIPARVKADAMYRPPKLIAVACIAVVLLTAATPALWDAIAVVFEPLDTLFGIVLVVETTIPVDDVSPSPFPFVAALESRGPPVL